MRSSLVAPQENQRNSVQQFGFEQLAIAFETANLPLQCLYIYAAALKELTHSLICLCQSCAHDNLVDRSSTLIRLRGAPNRTFFRPTTAIFWVDLSTKMSILS